MRYVTVPFDSSIVQPEGLSLVRGVVAEGWRRGGGGAGGYNGVGSTGFRLGLNFTNMQLFVFGLSSFSVPRITILHILVLYISVLHILV